MADDRFTNEAVRDVLARAIEFDHAHSDTVSRSQLESIAGELGISQAAVVAALRERRNAPILRDVPFRIRAAVATWSAIGGLSTLAAASMYSATQLPVFTLSLLGWIGISVGLASLGSAKLHRRFLARNAGFWLGVAGAQLISVLWDATLAESVRIVLVPNAMLWLVTSVAGAVILKLREWRRRRLDVSGHINRDRWSQAKARVRIKLKAWIDHILSRSLAALKLRGRVLFRTQPTFLIEEPT